MKENLKSLQSLSLGMKIQKSLTKIMQFHARMDGNVFISFSGGKDSTVLLHLVRSIFPHVRAVFAHTGLEYPEVAKFAMSQENVEVVRPRKTFKQIIQEFGYPVISKDVSLVIEYCGKGSTWAKNNLAGLNADGSASPYKKGMYSKYEFLLDAPFKVSSKCCYYMKEQPLDSYAKKNKIHPFIGTLACESKRRMNGWLQTGCNIFDGKKPRSAPLSFWLERHILQYIQMHNLQIPSVYGDIADVGGKLKTTGCDRTGCMFCLFGCHSEKQPNRIQRMSETHPKIYNYILKPTNDGGLGLAKVMDFVGIPYIEEVDK